MTSWQLWVFLTPSPCHAFLCILHYCWTCRPKPLSLYSTRTQNYWRWVLLRRLTQKIVLLRYLTQKIPTCWYFWRWVRHIFCVLPDAKPKSCVLPDANPRRQPVEYRWRWVLALGLCVGHVHFIFFVLISFAFCSRRKPVFRWNMGFKPIFH